MSVSRVLTLLFAVVVVVAAAACTGASSYREAPRVEPAPPSLPVATPPAATVPSPFSLTPQTSKRLLVVATASVQGYVEPCGCTGDPLGGVARLAALLDQARAATQDRVLFVDGGDLLFEKTTDTAAVDRCQHEARTQLLVSSYARAGLAATTRGLLDDVRGAAERDALLVRHGVKSVEGGQGIVVRRGDVTALVVGLASDADVALANATVARERGAGVIDVVVALVQRDLKGARALAAGLVGVDVVIVGKAAEAPSPPEQVGQAVLVQPGWQAQHVAVVDVVLDGQARDAPLKLDDRVAVRDGRVKLLDVRVAELDKLIASLPDGDARTFQQGRRDRFAAERDALRDEVQAPLEGPHIAVRAIPLRRGMAEEARAAADLATYTAAIPRLVTQCEAGVVCPEPPPEVRRYVGVETCRACHAGAVAFWEQATVLVPRTEKDGTKTTRRSGHALAMETLVHDGREKDRSCVACHSAGFDVEGGACTTTALLDKGLGGVQCESCHGAGSAHVLGGGDKTKIARDVPEVRCRECHLPPHIQAVTDFVYNERLLHVLGDGHGAERARRLRHDKDRP